MNSTKYQHRHYIISHQCFGPSSGNVRTTLGPEARVCSCFAALWSSLAERNGRKEGSLNNSAAQARHNMRPAT